MKFFIDIETAPQTNIFAGEFKDSAYNIISAKVPVTDFDRFCTEYSVNAEFAKIVALGIGYVKDGCFNSTVLYGNEYTILTDFCKMIDKSGTSLVAHNGIEFDYPFISRRLLVNDIKLPSILNNSGKKPWEIIGLYDTLQMWKFGSFQNRTSLAALCHAFNIPSPKDQMSGADVPKAFYEGKIDQIVYYCNKDILSLAKVYNRITGDTTTQFTTTNFKPYVPLS